MISHIASAMAVIAVVSDPAHLSAATPPVAIPDAIAGQGYHLAEDWNFVHDIRSASALRTAFYTRFVYDGGRLDHLNDEWERYRDNNNHMLADDGLELTARLEGPLQTGAIESGMIRSKWTGQYGYFEAEVRVPRGKSLWPAFWLNPEDGGWPPEIDVFEILDGNRDSTACSFHYLHPGSGVAAATTASRLDHHDRYCPGFDYADGFHRFGVLWTPTSVSHYVDGTLVVSRPFTWTHKDGRPAGPAHILLNLAVGGGWPGAPQTGVIFPAALTIHYVRVWQQ